MESQWRIPRNRAWLLLVFALIWTALAASIAPRPSWAQGDEQKPAAAAAADENQTVQPKETKSWFAWIVQSSGFIGLVILLLSIYFVSTVARMFFELRMSMPCRRRSWYSVKSGFSSAISKEFSTSSGRTIRFSAAC